MIRAVIFDMFETLVTLFEGKPYFAARDAGMHPVQCTWFHDRAFEPHIPCPILDEFDHADTQMYVLKYL